MKGVWSFYVKKEKAGSEAPGAGRTAEIRDRRGAGTSRQGSGGRLEDPVIQGDRTDRRADDKKEERTEQIQVRRSQLAIFNGVYIMKNTKNGIGENA